MMSQYYYSPFYQPLPVPEFKRQQPKEEKKKENPLQPVLDAMAAKKTQETIGNAIGGPELYPGGYGTLEGSQPIPWGFESAIPTVLPYAGAAIGAGLLAKGAKDLLNDNETKGVEGWGGRAQLAFTTMGASELARATGLLGHKSTRKVAQDHTKDLLGQHQNDNGYQSYVKGMREQYNFGPPDPSKPFAGKYSNWDEYKNAGLEAGDLSGVYGNIKTFGRNWTNIDQKKREEVTKALINADLYNSKKGEVEITDEDRARQIYEELTGAMGD